MGRRIGRIGKIGKGVDRTARQPIPSSQKARQNDLSANDRTAQINKGSAIALPYL